MPQKSFPQKSQEKISEQKKLLTGRFLRILLFLFLIGCLALIIWFFFFRSAKPTFNEERAFQYLVQQCEFGPRYPGSEGHAQCKQFLVEELENFCDRVWQQNFEYRDKLDSAKVYYGTNIIASINLHPKRRKRIMLCAHWDTRPWADEDPNPKNHDKPIIGANDGASGVAVLLEIAHALKGTDLDIGVDIILFDMEDFGDHGAEQYPDSLNPFSIGSEYFVSNNTNYRPAFGILVDMVGDRDLQIKREALSQINAAPIVDKVWEVAAAIGAEAFVDVEGKAVMDDHVPFLKRSIPVINIIDFEYPYWHTMEDTPDKCSPKSLLQVGEVLLEVILNEG